jgi:hypothetical protein
MAPKPLPRVLTIRYNRATGAWLTVIGSTALLALLVYDFLFDSRSSLPYAIPYFMAALLLLAGLTAVLRTAYFTYDSQAERIETRTLFGVHRTYPRSGYDWIAYSTDPIQIREVAPGGRSRAIPISHLSADPDDWAEFIDHLLNLSAPGESDAIEGRA